MDKKETYIKKKLFIILKKELSKQKALWKENAQIERRLYKKKYMVR